jgi:predicted transcriptional regulator
MKERTIVGPPMKERLGPRVTFGKTTLRGKIPAKYVLDAKRGRLRILPTTAELLKAWRKRMKFSQSAAAMKLKISKRTLQNWEQGHREPVGFALRELKEKIK